MAATSAAAASALASSASRPHLADLRTAGHSVAAAAPCSLSLRSPSDRLNAASALVARDVAQVARRSARRATWIASVNGGPGGPTYSDGNESDEADDVAVSDESVPDDILETLAQSAAATQAAAAIAHAANAAGGGDSAEEAAAFAASEAAEAAARAQQRQLRDLKLCLIDSLYGTERGFRASGETRAEVAELVAQLEAANPTEAPTESPALDGNWVLVYTFSELLPLLAAGQVPLVRVGAITQSVDLAAGAVSNAISFEGPLTASTIRVDAKAEVRSGKRLQVKFEQVTFSSPQPLDGASSAPLAPIVLFGQTIDLAPLAAALQPLQQAALEVAKVVSGAPPLALPIDGERASGWQLITYLDDDFRIARGDAGSLFVLVREGSDLLE
ncbi:hypothetical protein CLOM_g6567 [Closterium sp. NIES-68]|nr:hypothetical protein CLOM_g6567 [Closterium sp. NIES-68]GJP75722.1 hypothetical protein CLOP_g6130 [Closterium sp. NIES-67]